MRPCACAVLWGLAASLLVSCSLEHSEPRVNLSEAASKEDLRQALPAAGGVVYRFGFDRRAGPREDARQYLPFLAYLKAATGYAFELRFTPKASTIVDELGLGRVHFAAVGAGSYLQAREWHGAVPLVRGVNSAGRAEYRSVIVTAPGSPVRSVKDLKGRSFAFGAFASTQGHVIPRIVFREHGFDVGDLGSAAFTGSHRNTADAVVSRRFEAGGMQDTLGFEMAQKGLVKIVYTSRFYPSSGIAASAAVAPEVRETVRRALLAFAPKGAHAQGLYHWDRTEMPLGFVAAAEEDYAELGAWMRRFGLLAREGPEAPR